MRGSTAARRPVDRASPADLMQLAPTSDPPMHVGAVLVLGTQPGFSGQLARRLLEGFYTFDRSAHSPVLEEPEKARRIMREDVLAGTNSLADESPPMNQVNVRPANPSRCGTPHSLAATTTTGSASSGARMRRVRRAFQLS